MNLQTRQTLDTILHQILNQALVTVGADSGSMMLVDTRRGLLQIKARLGSPRAGRLTEPVYSISDNTIAGWVAKNRRPYVCPDVEVDPHFTRSRSGINFRSLMSVPILYGSRVLAVLNADAKDSHYFTDAHLATLVSIAEEVAGPIAERVSIFDALAEVGLELARLPQEGDVNLVLNRIAQAAVRSLGADVVCLYQYIQKDSVFPVEDTGPIIAGEIRDSGPMRRRVYPQDVPWRVVNERRSGFYSNVQGESFLTADVQRPGDFTRPRFVDREGIKAVAALLLPNQAARSRNEEVVGVMFANYRSEHEFNIDDISVLETFADYAAAAILNARKEEQRRSEQMRMVESISANFAHRMNTLAGIGRVNVQLIKERIDPADSRTIGLLDEISNQSERLLGLAYRFVQPFRTTGKLLALTSLNITPLIELASKEVGSDFSDIEIIQDVAPRLPLVRSTDFQLQQVVTDMLRNAAESISQGYTGRVSVRVRFLSARNVVEVTIEDNGKGMAPELQERIFAPGVTTRRYSLGIGLWWCRTFMRATGGDVILRASSVGRGTTFAIEVPCDHTDVSGLHRSLAEARSRPSADRMNVLIVDDLQEWRDKFVSILGDAGYTIRTADSYLAASHELASHQFDVAIVDMRLVDHDDDNRDGLRLLEHIESAELDTRVIIVTGYGAEADIRIAERNHLCAGIVDKKALDVKELRRLVATYASIPQSDSSTPLSREPLA
jgi:signal transduction histidine kinase/CheY-like chemotaxis protein